MKHFILTILMLFGIVFTTDAQIQTYKATAYAQATINQYTGKYTWSDWYKSDVIITINLDRDIITIYSKQQQTYFVEETEGSFIDSSGGKQVSFKVIDQDRDGGHIRLRIEKNGNSQLYVDFTDCAWVYNIYRVK